jgi:hypothetical protein
VTCSKNTVISHEYSKTASVLPFPPPTTLRVYAVPFATSSPLNVSLKRQDN